MRSVRSASRLQTLREALPATVDLLYHRRASEIADIDIDDYVALDWLQWNGGGLRLTTTGDNVCQQLAARVR